MTTDNEVEMWRLRVEDARLKFAVPAVQKTKQFACVMLSVVAVSAGAGLGLSTHPKILTAILIACMSVFPVLEIADAIRESRK